MSKPQHESSVCPPTQLYNREQARALLGGICVMTLRRLEDRGALKPIKLNKSRNSRVYYRADDVRALVDRATD